MDAKELAHKIYLETEGYLDDMCDEVDQKELTEKFVVLLDQYADFRLEEAAKNIEGSVNIKNIDEPSVECINCHIQSKHDARLCRALQRGGKKG